MIKALIDNSDFVAVRIFDKLYKKTESETHSIENVPGVVKSILTKDMGGASANKRTMTLTVLLKNEAPLILTVSLIHQRKPKWMVKSVGATVGKHTNEVKKHFCFLTNLISNTPHNNTEMMVF